MEFKRGQRVVVTGQNQNLSLADVGQHGMIIYQHNDPNWYRVKLDQGRFQTYNATSLRLEDLTGVDAA